MPTDADPPPTTGPGLDRRKVRRSFARAAASFDSADFLQTEIRERLLDRLQWVRLEPQRILDLGAGTGKALPGLAARFPRAELVAVDLTEGMLRAAVRRSGVESMAVCGDASRLPLADQSVDLVFSSLMIHWCPSLDTVFAEVRRVLRHPGLFSFATLGPDSFRELREAWRKVDSAAHVMSFPEMRALGDGLVRAGLAEPVVDAETLTIRYRDIRQLTGDFRATGTTNPNSSRSPGLTGRGTWARLEAAYETARDSTGALPATLEVVYGHAWAPDPRPGGQRRDGEIAIPVAGVTRRT